MADVSGSSSSRYEVTGPCRMGEKNVQTHENASFIHRQLARYVGNHWCTVRVGHAIIVPAPCRSWHCVSVAATGLRVNAPPASSGGWAPMLESGSPRCVASKRQPQPSRQESYIYLEIGAAGQHGQPSWTLSLNIMRVSTSCPSVGLSMVSALLLLVLVGMVSAAAIPPRSGSDAVSQPVKRSIVEDLTEEPVTPGQPPNSGTSHTRTDLSEHAY